jgi:hypothetical protein
VDPDVLSAATTDAGAAALSNELSFMRGAEMAVVSPEPEVATLPVSAQVPDLVVSERPAPVEIPETPLARTAQLFLMESEPEAERSSDLVPDPEPDRSVQ